MRIAGSTLVVAWAAETGLKEAADRDRLESATYRRLALGCGLKSLGYLAAFCSAKSLWCPALIATYPSLALLSCVINLATFFMYQLKSVQKQLKAATEGQTQAQVTLGSFISSLKDVAPKLLPSPSVSPSAQQEAKVYSIISLVYFFVAIGCVLFPLDLIHANFPPRPTDALLGSLLQERQALVAATCAPGFLLASAACQVLSDAAERGRLNGGTFRRLNLGLGLMEVLLALALLSSSLFPGPMQVTFALDGGGGGSEHELR